MSDPNTVYEVRRESMNGGEPVSLWWTRGLAAEDSRRCALKVAAERAGRVLEPRGDEGGWRVLGVNRDGSRHYVTTLYVVPRKILGSAVDRLAGLAGGS